MQNSTGMHPIYEITIKETEEEGIGKHVAYGIRALNCYTRETLSQIDNISDDRELVQNVILLFNKNRLQLVNFEQTVTYLTGILL